MSRIREVLRSASCPRRTNIWRGLIGGTRSDAEETEKTRDIIEATLTKNNFLGKQEVQAAEGGTGEEDSDSDSDSDDEDETAFENLVVGSSTFFLVLD